MKTPPERSGGVLSVPDLPVAKTGIWSLLTAIPSKAWAGADAPHSYGSLFTRVYP